MHIEGSSLVLAGNLSVDQTMELRALLLTMVADHPGGFTVDVSLLSGMDMAIMQLLIAAHHTLTAQGGGLALRAVPPVMEQLFAEAGLPLGNKGLGLT